MRPVKRHILAAAALTFCLAAQASFIDSGNGTPARPYRITSADDLVEFAGEVSWGNTFRSRYVVLDTDLDMSLYEDFTPIGVCGDEAATSTSFEGTFDGLFHTISGLTILDTATGEATGLFASIDNGGTVCNLHMGADCYISGDGNTGMVAGRVWDGDIIFCSNDGRADGRTRTGGIVGDMRGGLIYGCCNHGQVQTTEAGAGGIVGRADGTISIYGCYNTGHVTSRRAGACGGIAAMAYTHVDFAACYNAGRISGRYSEAFEISPAPIASDIPELIWTGTMEGCCYDTALSGDVNQNGAVAMTTARLSSAEGIDYLNENLPALDRQASVLDYPYEDTVYRRAPQAYGSTLPILGWELRSSSPIDEIESDLHPRLDIRGTMVRAADGSTISAWSPTGRLVDRGTSLTLPQGFYIIEGQKVLIR